MLINCIIAAATPSTAAAGASGSAGVKVEPGVKKEEDDAMDVDEGVAGEADPEYLQQVLEGLPTNSPKKEGDKDKKPEPKGGAGSRKK